MKNEIKTGNANSKNILVICGPSGVGKTELEKRLCSELGCKRSVSVTTRKPRPGEVDGIHYHFVSRRVFEEMITRGDFLERAEVHGEYYGTQLGPILDAVVKNSVIIRNLDVQGHAAMRACKDERITSRIVSVFLIPPSMKELRRRLFGRGDVDEASANRRLEHAKEEMRHKDEFDYRVVARNKKYTFDQLARIIRENVR